MCVDVDVDVDVAIYQCLIWTMMETNRYLLGDVVEL